MGYTNLDRLMNRFSIFTFFVAALVASFSLRAQDLAEESAAPADGAVVEGDRDPAQAPKKKAKAKATVKKAPEAQPTPEPTQAASATTTQARPKATAAKKSLEKKTIPVVRDQTDPTEDYLPKPPTAANLPATNMRGEEVPKSPFTGTFVTTLGNDTNLLVTPKNRAEGSFYEFKPTMSYAAGSFTIDASVKLKDFTKEQNSVQAKSTEAGFGSSWSYGSGTMTGKTTIGAAYKDARWVDLVDSTDNGMQVASYVYKLAQGLGLDLGGAKVDAEAAYIIDDARNTWTYAPDIFGTKGIERNFKQATAKAGITVPFSDSFSVSATPSVSHKKFDERHGRQTDGSGAVYIPGDPEMEFLDIALEAGMKISMGRIALSPSITTGKSNDEAMGAEDASSLSAGLGVEIAFPDRNNLKFVASYKYTTISYDNWTDEVENGEKREDNDTESGVSASIDVVKGINVGLSYANTHEESNLQDVDDNYTQEVTSLAVTFAW